MGHRTEASARFEKSLDPENTIIAIARFHKLAKHELPGLKLASTLSDCYPEPQSPLPIELDCDFASRFIGRDVSQDEIVRILTALEFECERSSGHKLSVTPPSYRATKDIEIEADLIEEVARFIGYNNIEATLPTITARCFETTPALVLELVGAEVTLSPIHTCAYGVIKKETGLAIRFPRFTGRWRDDKSPEEATTSKEIVEMYKAKLKKVE